MDLNEHIERVVRRSRAFCAADRPGHFLVSVRVPADGPAMPPLNSLELDRELDRWLDAQLAAARPAWRAKAGLDDDAIPAICPYFGIAEHSAWLGLDVRLQETTCLPAPAVGGPADLDRVRLSEQSEWFARMRDAYAYLRSRRDGEFVLSVRGAMAPMELANALRGDELFTDFLLDPPFAHRLMRFCAEAMRWYYDRLLSWADPIEDGRVFTFGGWIGPRCIGHLANDAAMLCSAKIYAEFGYPYEAELVGHYRTLFYHVHNERMHFVPRLAELPGLVLLEVTQDPRTPPTLEDLDRILGATGGANLRLVGTSDQVRADIQSLRARNCQLEVRCRDRGDAEDVLALVRDRSAPLR